jgi:ribonuclease P protein component
LGVLRTSSLVGPFGKDRRLRKRADFLRVQSQGQRVSSPHFTMLVAARSEIVDEDARPPSRLGVVVTRKIGGAVQRNRVKRLCRECFRSWPDFLPDGVDFVVIARTGAHELGLADVRGEWERAHRALQKRASEALAHPPAKHHVSPRVRPPTP